MAPITTEKKKNAENSTRKRVIFELSAESGAEVVVAGTFNDWNPEKHPLSDKKGDGVYRCSLLLEPGQYEYKFRTDGVWSVDPNNPQFAANDFGTLNSVLVVE